MSGRTETVRGAKGRRSRSARYWMKRWTARVRRRLARLLLDEAPTKSRYRGWLN